MRAVLLVGLVLSTAIWGSAPMTNLYLTLLDRMGVHPEQIGDSTGRVEHLTEV
jgi:hypothetical protein